MAGQLHRGDVYDGALSRRQARRLSRRFAAVGVKVEPGRLQQISSGAPTIGSEHVDVTFAMAVAELSEESRTSRLSRTRQRAWYGLLIGAMVLLSLAALIAMAMGIVSMVQPAAG
ncbi:hypothetical protein [Mycobacterium sp. OTB74]|uniref:hypothetical protein n=1 Tax=Mycobacterium sp. OTB74 TaxID=1853452 RepID=UPI0024738D92|nr:hypothetical protein [Mycobacterium sp. OTB74]MDH6244112.1 hypothetical protein [Mycobacterium sp. OTB74]